VKDRSGAKLQDPERIERLRADLLRVAHPGEEHGGG
jgi:hypothetical protein